jgi:peptidoglycan biosynthesis protein MviN/MurJ (putative lipid II flippase)
MLVAGLELAVNFGLSILFVQQYGLVGIAFATVLASVLDKLILMFWLRSSEGITPKSYWPWKWHLGYSIIIGLTYWTMT